MDQRRIRSVVSWRKQGWTIFRSRTSRKYGRTREVRFLFGMVGFVRATLCVGDLTIARPYCELLKNRGTEGVHCGV